MAIDNADRDPVEKLAEEFLAKYRSGTKPSVDTYAEKHPELAEQIRDLFPTLLLMEKFCPDEVDSSDRGTATESSLDSMDGQFGEYQIVRTIGRGGMGIVYEAIHQSLDRHVALKVLPSTRLDGEVARERFRQEARAAAQLHHTNIVPVFDVGEVDGVPFYAMQFIKGKSLNELVKLRRISQSTGLANGHRSETVQNNSAGKRSPGISDSIQPGSLDSEGDSKVGSSLNAVHETSSTVGDNSSLITIASNPFFREVARIGMQVADALAFVHRQNILHRDIKPSNLILDDLNRIWITDFGLAKTAGSTDLTHTGGVVGTLRYMAPERFHGVSDAAGDIYSLGVTLYELITDQSAFAEEDRVRLIDRIKNEDPPKPRKIDPRIPVDLETIILKAIDKDPNRRYSNAKQLSDDLRRWLNHEPISARPITPIGRVIRWSKRRPLVAGLVASIIVLTAVGFSLVTWKWSEANRQRELAELNSQRAQNIVHEFYSEVAKSWGLLHSTPGTQKLRQHLMGKAERYFAQFLNEHPSSTTELQVANANCCLGEILEDAGKLEKAKVHFQRAIDSLEELVKRCPNDFEPWQILARCYSGMANLVYLTEGSAASIKNYEAALEVATRLYELSPESQSSANNVAAIRTNLGLAFMMLGKSDLAIKHYRIAIEIREQFSDPEFAIKKGLGISYIKMGDLLMRSAQDDQAIKHYEKAYENLEQLLGEYSHLSWVQRDFGSCCVVLGSAYRQTGKFDRAEDVYDKGIKAIERLCRQNPNMPTYKSLLAKALNNSGSLNNRLGNRRQSSRLYRQAIEIREKLVSSFPKSAEYRDELAISQQNLAWNLLRGGETQRAVELNRKAVKHLETLSTRQGLDADYQNNLAKAYRQLGASLLKLAEKDNQAKVESTKLIKKSIAILQPLCEKYPQIIQYKNNLATSYIDLAKSLITDIDSDSKESVKEPEKIFKDAISILSKLVDDHPNNLTFKNNLALAHLNIGVMHHIGGDSDLGIEKMKKAVELRRRFCSEHPRAAMMQLELVKYCNTLGHANFLVGNHKTAIEVLSDSISIGTKLCKNKSGVVQFQLELIDAHDKLAAVYRVLKNYPLALEQCRHAEAVARSLDLTALNPVILKGFADRKTNMGRYYSIQGEYDESMESYRDAIKLRMRLTKQLPRRGHLNELASDHNKLGAILVRKRELLTASDHFKLAAEIREAMDSKSAPTWELSGLATTYTGQADIDRKMGRDASSNYQKAIDLRTRIAKQDPEDRFNQYQLAGQFIGLAAVQRQQGDLENSEEQYRKALKLHDMLANKYPDVLIYEVSRWGSHVNVSLSLRGQDLFEEALTMQETAEAGLKKVLGKDPDHKTAKNYLANCKNAQANTHYQYALRLANTAKNKLTRQKSLEHIKLACEISSWKIHECITLHAFVSASLGDFEKAVELQEKAIDLADQKNTPGLQKRLSLYRQNKLPTKQSGQADF